MSIHTKVLLLITCFILPIGAQACSDAYVDKVPASEDSIVIGDFGCEFSERTIFKLTPNVLGADGTPKPVLPVTFNSECRMTNKGGFACRKEGASLLAGTTYKSVPT